MSLDFAYMMEEDISELVGVLVSLLSTNLLSFGLAIAAYVLTGLGFYAIAQRRGIKHPWMAWVPVLKLWILGSIADQYRYVVKGEVRNRRKVLIALAVVQVVAVIVVYALLIGMVVNMIVQVPDLDRMTEQQVLEMVLKTFLPMLGVLLVMLVVALVSKVFQYIAYYDLFASCDPENKVLFLVLGILFDITLPFFVFACRKKDRGMPPRRVQQATPVEPAEAEQPVYQEPEEPWVDSEE